MPIPAKYPRGILITSAQGHEITSNTNARYIQILKEASGIIQGGTKAIRAAINTTAGV